MDLNSELKTLAEQAGCLEVAAEAERKTALLMQQNHTNVVVTGDRGSGKTRFINHLVGFEVWEEGRMDDEEKPLRVAFEPLPEDERYHCLTAANRQWYGEAAILYEFREEAILRDGIQTENLDNMDVVLYLISARAPFNINQVKALRALAPLKRYVVLTGLETVAPKDQQQVLEYVNRFIGSLDLPPAIIWREDTNQDLGREVRNLLPAYQELQQLRRQHAEYHSRNAAAQIRGQAQAELDNNSAQREKAAVNQEQSAADMNRERREWVNLLNELREMQLHAQNTVTAHLDQDCARVTARILESGRSQGFSEPWRKNAPAQLENELRKLAQTRGDRAWEIYCKDIQDIADSAKALRLTRYQEADFRRLGEALHRKHSGGEFWVFPNPTLENPEASVGSGKTKVLLGTGAAVGFFTLAPFSLAMSMIGIVGSVGVGAAYYKKISDEEFQAALEAGMKEYQDVLRGALGDWVNHLYQDAKLLLGEKTRNFQSIPAPEDAIPYEEKARILTNVVRRCDEFLNR